MTRPKLDTTVHQFRTVLSLREGVSPEQDALIEALNDLPRGQLAGFIVQRMLSSETVVVEDDEDEDGRYQDALNELFVI